MTADLPKLSDVIRSYNLRAKKKLGQNFLLDPYLLSRIVRSAGDLQGKTVIEIGPGPGGLTRAILDQNPTKLYAIELDPTCVEIMHDLKTHYPNLEPMEADALTIDCSQLGDSPRLIISNLPYNVSVPLLFRWLEHMDSYESLTLMFQKEVAKRITAQPRSSDYGKLSVMAQWCSCPSILFDVPPGAFSPPPKVTSSIVRITPRDDKIAVDASILSKVTQAAFNQRRKMLRSSLKSITPHAIELLEKAGIDPTRRGEELSVDEFCHLAQVLSGT